MLISKVQTINGKGFFTQGLEAPYNNHRNYIMKRLEGLKLTAMDG